MSQKDPYSLFSEDLLERAEAMSTKIRAEVSVDRRGDTPIHAGVVTDLEARARRVARVEVADCRDNAWLTLISARSLDAARDALLVYRPQGGADVRIQGRLEESRAGSRDEDWQAEEAQFFARFIPIRRLPPARQPG